MKSAWNPFGVGEWLAWLGATLAAGVGITVFAFQQFETRTHAVETVTQVHQQFEAVDKNTGQRIGSLQVQLDRVEMKVDRLLERTQ